MTDYRFLISDEHYQIIKSRQEDLPGTGVISKAFDDFESKAVFSWHLSLMVEFNSRADYSMPSKEEQEVVDAFGDSLDRNFKGSEPGKPNALFLARITWNKTRELIYRVFEPEPVHQNFTRLTDERTSPSAFDYHIDNDPDWKLAKRHLNAANAQQSKPKPGSRS